MEDMTDYEVQFPTHTDRLKMLGDILARVESGVVLTEIATKDLGRAVDVYAADAQKALARNPSPSN